jgi:hypothetical protein
VPGTSGKARADWLGGTSNGSPEGISDVPRAARGRCWNGGASARLPIVCAKDDVLDTLLKES